MPIADRTTRQMNHSFHVIAARIVVITPRKFVLQMIKLDSLFVVCRYVRAQFSSFPLEGGDWGKLTKGQGVMFLCSFDETKWGRLGSSFIQLLS